MSREDRRRGRGDNQRGSRDREKSGSWQKNIQVKGAIEDLPVLRYGDNSNYAEFKRALSTYALRVYGELGVIIDDFEYPQVHNPELVLEDYEEDADPVGVLKHITFERFKIREQEEADMRKKKPQLFATIWGQLSRESEEKIRQLTHYEDSIRKTRDPLELWKAIRETHVIATSGVAEADAYKAEERYNNLRQRPDESLAMFKQRTDEALAAMRAVGAPIPTSARQAVAFIKRLDKYRYAELQVELENDARRNVKPYPATLADAFKVAGDYQVVKRVPGGSGAQTSVFLTSASNYRRAGQSDAKKKNNFKKQRDYDKGEDHKRDDQRENRRGDGGCRLCGKTDHFVSRCPDLEACKKLMLSKSNSDKRMTERANITHGNEVVYLVDIETALSSSGRTKKHRRAAG